MKKSRLRWLVLGLAMAVLAIAVPMRKVNGSSLPPARQVMVPGEDRFLPFVMTIPVGQSVIWTNNDIHDHLLISIDAFDTAGHLGTNVTIPANGGQVHLKFTHAGVFPYYCAFHATLDADNQPMYPGQFGGIQGTPMMGVIAVINE